MSEIYTSRKLKSLYGKKFPFLVDLGVCVNVPRKTKKEHRKYALAEGVDNLPSSEELSDMIRKCYASSVESHLDGAFSTVEELGEEIREWWENLGENLQCSSKGEELEECADTLEYIERVEVDLDKIKDLVISFMPTHSSYIKTRSDRLGEAKDTIHVVIDYLQEVLDSQEEDEGDGQPEIVLTDDEKESLEGIIQELETAVEGLEDVSFPSMY